MDRLFAKAGLLVLAPFLPGCGPAEGPGGVHAGDHFSTRSDDFRAEGFVSGWVGDRWIEIHKVGDLVQRIDLEQVRAFKVRCSHE